MSKAQTHANVIVAATTPDVKGHFKANDQDAEVQLGGSFPQRMLTMVFVQTTLGMKNMLKYKERDD